MNRLTEYSSEIRWVPCRNDSAEEVPARAIMRPTGILETDAGPLVTIAKPNADSAAGYCVNGPDRIPVGGYGSCTFDAPVQILHETADGVPAVGQRWGSKNNSWKVHKVV